MDLISHREAFLEWNVEVCIVNIDRHLELFPGVY